MRKFLPVIVAVAAVMLYQRVVGPATPPASLSRATPASYQPEAAGLPAEAEAPTAVYRCDGRKRCSHMTSCAEAEWFLANCPGMEMDGDNDGIPCERQCP